MKTQIAELRIENKSQEIIEYERFSELVSLINKNVSPIQKVSEDDVYIRVMYIVSDEVNSYGGQFAYDELERLTELIVDSPVLVGHRKDKLPIARNFHSEIETDGERTWVKSYFYWLKKAEGSDTLKENIDGGIYKECSIGFTFNYPECTICTKDIRRCPHEPFAEYKSGRKVQKCFYYYKEIDKVLETSLVYRGAVPDTSISDRLFQDTIEVAASYTKDDLDKLNLDENQLYYAIPKYDGISIRFTKHTANIAVEILGDSNINDARIIHEIKALPFSVINQQAIVVGYRGKERCSKASLLKYLQDKKSEVTRLDIKLVPTDSLLKFCNIIRELKNFTLLKMLCLKGYEFGQYKSKIMTKDGLELCSLTYTPIRIHKDTNDYRLFYAENNNYYLEFYDGIQNLYRIINFSERLLKQKRKFLLEQIVSPKIKIKRISTLFEGNIKERSKLQFYVNQVKLNNRIRYLFHIK